MALTTRLEFTDELAFHTNEGDAHIEIGDDTIELTELDLDELQEFINIARENTDEGEPLTFASGGYMYTPTELKLGPESLSFLARISGTHLKTDGRDCE